MTTAMEISSGLKIGSPNFFFNSMPSSYARRLMTTPKNEIDRAYLSFCVPSFVFLFQPDDRLCHASGHNHNDDGADERNHENRNENGF